MGVGLGELSHHEEEQEKDVVTVQAVRCKMQAWLQARGYWQTFAGAVFVTSWACTVWLIRQWFAAATVCFTRNGFVDI